MPDGRRGRGHLRRVRRRARHGRPQHPGRALRRGQGEPGAVVAPERGLEGHIVQGHVDGTASVQSVQRGADWVVEFACPTELTDAMVPRGSVAVDGVSLTLASVRDGGFSVALIPTTLAATTLGNLAVGDAVNVETDVLGKYVAKVLGKLDAPGGGLTLEKLKESGFA